MKLRSGKTYNKDNLFNKNLITPDDFEVANILLSLKRNYTKRKCDNCDNCELTTPLCCYCMDKRERSNGYVVYNCTYMRDFTIQNRNYYYCPSCKK